MNNVRRLGHRTVVSPLLVLPLVFACGGEEPKTILPPPMSQDLQQPSLDQIVERIVAASRHEGELPTAVETAATEVLAKAEAAGTSDVVMNELREVTASLVAWSRKMEEHRKQADPTSLPPAFPSILSPTLVDSLFPPAPPSAAGANSNDKEADDSAQRQQEMLNALLSMAGAALCLVEPPLCAVVMPLMAAIGLGGDTRSAAETLSEVQAAVQTGKWDPELTKKLAKQLDALTGGQLTSGMERALAELPEALEGTDSFEAALARLAEEALTETKLVDALIAQLPDWGQRVVKAISEGSEPDFVLSLLPSDDRGPYFKNETQKRLVQVGVRFIGTELEKNGEPGVIEKYWDSTLAKVGTESDPNRRAQRGG